MTKEFQGNWKFLSNSQLVRHLNVCFYLKVRKKSPVSCKCCNLMLPQWNQWHLPPFINIYTRKYCLRDNRLVTTTPSTWDIKSSIRMLFIRKYSRGFNKVLETNPTASLTDRPARSFCWVNFGKSHQSLHPFQLSFYTNNSSHKPRSLDTLDISIEIDTMSLTTFTDSVTEIGLA